MHVYLSAIYFYIPLNDCGRGESITYLLSSPHKTMPLLTVTAHSPKKFLEYRTEWAENKGQQKKETKRRAAQAESGRLENSRLERLILRGDRE